MKRIQRGKKRLKFLDKELAAECSDNVVDSISQLPDDILISIISRLTLREATATSSLSTRWRHLCAYVSCLDFPPLRPNTNPFGKYKQEIKETEEKRFPNFVKMVNHTLDSHKGRVLKEFKVHIPSLEGVNIERWLEFALTREVEIIVIDMFFLRGATRYGYYTLGLLNLIRKNSGQSLPSLQCLKKLFLSDVHVDDLEVEVLISNFPLLESLSIAYSKRLKNLMVVGHSVHRLKHLDISYAWCLESIEVRDMINLVSLRCYKFPSTCVLQLNNVPKLIEFNTSDAPRNTLAEILPKIPSCVCDQLRVLRLWTNTMFINYYSPTYRLPPLINIKHLEVEVLMPYTTYGLFPLIEACHSLEEVVIKSEWGPSRLIKFENRGTVEYTPKRNLSPNLKKLKLLGYLGYYSELGFALFIIKNAVALEQVVVEPYDGSQAMRRMATARASQRLRPITPPSVNLVIIYQPN